MLVTQVPSGAGIGELGLGSLGPKWIMTLYFSERNWPPGVERARPTYRGWTLERESSSQRRSEKEGALEISTYHSYYSPGDSSREGKDLSKVPQGVRSEPGIQLGFLTLSLVQLIHNNAKNYTGINSRNSSYAETEASSDFLEITPRSLALELGNIWFTVLSPGCMICLRTEF